MKTKAILSALLCATTAVIAGTLIACNSSDNNGGSDAGIDAGQVKVTITGGAQKGPFKPKSDVQIFALDATGERVGTPMSKETGQKGDITVDLEVGTYEAVVQGRYWKEDEGELSGSDIKMSAVVNITEAGSKKLFINPLPHMLVPLVKKLIKAGTAPADAIAQAEAGILDLGFSLPAPEGLPVSTDLDLFGGDTDGNRRAFGFDCGLMYAAQIEAASTLERDAKLQEIIDNASFDMEANGVLSDSFKALMAQAEKTMNTKVCVANLEKFITNNNLTGITLPNIDKVVDTDGNGISNADEPNPGMLLIPSGDFLKGEPPGATANIATGYYMDIYEVTVQAFKACVDVAACIAPIGDSNCNWGVVGREFYPVNCVSWEQANAYCQWTSKRLPTDNEWEKAARGTDGRVYPWGNTPGPNCQNTVVGDAPGTGCGIQDTQPVGSRLSGDSPYGIKDMLGNVSEWTQEQHPRGGSYQSNTNGPVETGLVTYSLGWSGPTLNGNTYGVRCAKDAP